MAHKKKVQGRSYPFLYNVNNSVGAFKSLTKENSIIYGDIPNYDERGIPTPMRVPVGVKTQTILKSTYQPNKRDDVMLVQYLLKRVYQQSHNAQPPLKSGSGDPHSPAFLQVDGIWGPKTQSAIEKFQLDMRRNGRNIATDGCVDPEKGESSTSSISKTGYTISWLNKYFWILYPQIAPDIRIDPECPMELKRSLDGGPL